MKLTNCERAVLKHIKFWHPKSKTKYDGKKWVIQTAEEIREHLANGDIHYSQTYIKQTLQSLKRKGYIETLRKPHRFKDGLLGVNWISLRENDPIKEVKNIPPKGRKTSLGKDEKHPTEGTKIVPSIYTENITENIQKIYHGEEASSSQEKMGVDMVDLPEEKYQGFGSKGKGAKAILDKFNKDKSEKDLKVFPCTPVKVFDFYKSEYAKSHGFIGEVSNPAAVGLQIT